MSNKQKLFAQRLRERGYDFIEESRSLPGTPDLYFDKQRVAVFFNGCFWHGHSCRSKKLSPLWESKICSRQLKDQKQLKELIALHIRYIVIWECDFDRDPAKQVQKVIDRLAFI